MKSIKTRGAAPFDALPDALLTLILETVAVRQACAGWG